MLKKYMKKTKEYMLAKKINLKDMQNVMVK